MIVVGEVVEVCLEAEPRKTLVIQGHGQRRGVIHRDGQALAVDEELLDHVSPLRLLLVPCDHGFVDPDPYSGALWFRIHTCINRLNRGKRCQI